MQLPVTDLVGHPGATRRVVLRASRAELAADTWGEADVVLAGEVALDLHLEMLLEGLLVRGVIAFPTTMLCARCLREVRADQRVDVAEVFVDPAKLEHDDEIEPGYELRVPEGTIDLEALVRDAVVTSLPVRVLCREDCAGLCPVCGNDLNETDCGHRAGSQPDPRWAALRELALPPD